MHGVRCRQATRRQYATLPESALVATLAGYVGGGSMNVSAAIDIARAATRDFGEAHDAVSCFSRLGGDARYYS